MCGDHVLIFSDKAIDWPSGEPEIAWNRWVKRSILKSGDQVRGARRWIATHPGEIFLDAACTKRFPLPLPPPERMKVHGIVVARGAKDACRAHFNGGSGSLLIVPDVKGSDHLVGEHSRGRLFAVGDIEPDGPFIHVFDEVTLDVVLGELDTISDFADYLDRKSAFIRNGNLAFAAGEEELVAHYVSHTRKDGEHDFVHEDQSPFVPGQIVGFEEGLYANLRRNPQYLAKKQADADSYIWDRLIGAFTKHMIAGTTIVPDGEEFDLSQHEQGVRHMALVPRTERRANGRAVIGALERSVEGPRFCRAMIPMDGRSDTGFFFLTLQVPPEDILPGGYDAYRRARSNLAEAYAFGFLEKYRFLNRIVGIATEPVNSKGSSEDLVLALPPEWTEEAVQQTRETCQRIGIMDAAVAKESRFTEFEYPDETHAPLVEKPLTKRQRRRSAGKARSRKPRD